MNGIPSKEVNPSTFPKEEYEARLALAAVYRLLKHYGWDDLIFNHAAMRVPGRPDRFLIKRHELLYDEVTASNLVEVSMHDDLDEAAGVNRAGFTLHSGVMMARSDVNCSIHVHTVPGVAIAGLKHGLRQVSLHAVRFHNRLGYHDYEGVTETFDERARIAHDLGRNRAMIFRNHGLLTLGETPREAFNLLRDLIAAAETQLLMEATGAELAEIPPETCEAAAAQAERHDKGRGTADWPAYLRVLDRLDTSYRS